MIEKRVNGGFATVDQAYDAFGQSSFFEELVDVTHGERDALGGLEDERVAGGDGVGQIPERDHAGEIKRDDGGGDSDGLADHHLVDAAGDVFEVIALHHHGNAAGDLDVLNRPAHLGFRFGEGLAIFLRDDAGDVVDVIFEEHLQFEERLDAVFGRSAAPFGEGGGGGFDGVIDFSGIGEWDLSDYFAGSGIDYVAPFVGTRVGPLAVDVVRKLDDGGCGYGGHEFTSYYCAEYILRIPGDSSMIHTLQGSFDCGCPSRLRHEGQSSLRKTKLLLTLTALLRLSCRTLLRARTPIRRGLRLFARWLRPAEPARELHSSRCLR